MKKGWQGNITNSPEETIILGENLSHYLEGGDVLAMVGGLASGKTTFIKGLLQGLNYIKPVTSPTFTLINEYKGTYPVIHIDCYRENSMDRWIRLGFNDYLNLENIVIIEWADKIISLLPNNYIQIKFIHRGKNKRHIILEDI